MKRVLLTSLAVLMVAAAANAQWGTIDIFDQTDATCALTDAPAGILTIHLWHTNITSGATGNQFIVDKGPGVTISYFSDAATDPSILKIGTADAGISVAYGSCRSSDFHFLNVIYFTSATSTACSYLSILPSPASLTGLVEIIDCAATKHTYPSGGQAIMNDDGSCTCNVPVQRTTWGKVKALYN